MRLPLVFFALLPVVWGELRFRQWWKAVKNTPSCVRYVQQYSWTWVPSRNKDCGGSVCNFPKEICMSYNEGATDLKCQPMLEECYGDANVYFCPGRHQEYLECGPTTPKSCETPEPSSNGTCEAGCYCRDPWILVRSQRSVCVRKDHCAYFVDQPEDDEDDGGPAQWDNGLSNGQRQSQRQRPRSEQVPVNSHGADEHILIDQGVTSAGRRASSNDIPTAPRLPNAAIETPRRGRALFTGESGWKETSEGRDSLSAATAVPRYPNTRLVATPEGLVAKCVRGETEFPLGAELVEPDTSGRDWPYKIIMVCATDAAGRPSWTGVGCLDHFGRRVELGQSFLDSTNDFLMKCEGTKSVPNTMVLTVSCVYQNDTFFPNGSAWTVENIVRRCSLSSQGPGSVIRRVGCVDDFGDNVQQGEEFRTKDGLHLRKCLGPNGLDDWRTQIVACIDTDQVRQPCDQNYGIYARLKLAGYAKKLCKACGQGHRGGQ